MDYYVRKVASKCVTSIVKKMKMPEPEVIEGFGARSQVGEICKNKGYNRVLLITDENLQKLGMLEKITKSLKTNHIKYEVYDGVCVDPSQKVVKEGLEMGLACGAKCVICLGGGSVMDSGKIISAGLKNPKLSIEQLTRKFTGIGTGSLPIINIPSTAGTGAEVTCAAVITNDETHKKNATAVLGLFVETVILDSELTINAPQQVTASTGIDALSHGIESYISKIVPEPQNRFWGINSVQLAMENLPIVYKDPSNKEARQNMCRAAYYGGKGLNYGIAGYVHAIAHALGAVYHLPHGVAIAATMIPVLKYNQEECQEKYSELAVACNVGDELMTGYELSEAFLAHVEDLIHSVGMKTQMPQIQEQDYPVLIKEIWADSINYDVPKIMTEEELIKILNEISGDNNVIHVSTDEEALLEKAPLLIAGAIGFGAITLTAVHCGKKRKDRKLNNLSGCSCRLCKIAASHKEKK